MNPYALLAITKHGTDLARGLAEAMGDADLHVPQKFADVAGPGALAFANTVRGQLGELFRSYDGLVVFISLGAVVRMLAPLLQDKHLDPGVVVVDDRARYAISMLSGHLGGANALARRVAALLGAEPVITTASDVAGTIAVDLLGRDFGWALEQQGNVTPVSAAVVNEEPVAVFQDAGETNWWPAGRPLPATIHLVPSLEEAARPAFRAALIITDRLLGSQWRDLLRRAVVYRPRSLVVGLGCMAGTPAEELESLVTHALGEAGVVRASLRNVATSDLKRAEPGLLAFAAAWGLPITYYAAEDLNGVAEGVVPSETVERLVGLQGVCEPAALLSASTNRLLLPKHKSAQATVALARVAFETPHATTDPSRDRGGVGERRPEPVGAGLALPATQGAASRAPTVGRSSND